MKTFPHSQSGFSAILAVVLVVLLGLIGSYMSTQITAGSISTTLSFNGMQAWFAARSGIEWGIYQVLNQAPPGTGCSPFPGNFTIDNYAVTVTCSGSIEITEGPDRYYIYDLTSTVVSGSAGELTYIYRQITATATDAP